MVREKVILGQFRLRYIDLHCATARERYELVLNRCPGIVTLAFSFGVQGWREEVKQRGLTWPQLMLNPDTNPRDALAAYGIRSYPELIVIDAKGTIVACPRNLEELESVLKELR